MSEREAVSASGVLPRALVRRERLPCSRERRLGDISMAREALKQAAWTVARGDMLSAEAGHGCRAPLGRVG
jgi:hypothetical protein